MEESDDQWKNLFLEQIDKIVIAHDIFRLDLHFAHLEHISTDSDGLCIG